MLVAGQGLSGPSRLQTWTQTCLQVISFSGHHLEESLNLLDKFVGRWTGILEVGDMLLLGTVLLIMLFKTFVHALHLG